MKIGGKMQKNANISSKIVIHKDKMSIDDSVETMKPLMLLVLYFIDKVSDEFGLLNIK